MKTGDARWRLLPDENRTVAQLEYFDGSEWKPMPEPRVLETYTSNTMPPSYSARNDLCDEDEFPVRLGELAALTKPEHALTVNALILRLQELFDNYA